VADNLVASVRKTQELGRTGRGALVCDQVAKGDEGGGRDRVPLGVAAGLAALTWIGGAASLTIFEVTSFHGWNQYRPAEATTAVTAATMADLRTHRR
jgi:hypothetical protein